MKRILILSFLLTLSTISNLKQSQAGELLRFAGPQSSFGRVSSYQTVLSVRSNPAVASYLVNQEQPFRYGYLSSLGFGLELGDVENFEDEVNDLIDELERDDIGVDEAQDIIDRFNQILPQLGVDGYLNLNFDVSLPFGPFVWQHSGWGGALFADASKTVSMSTILLDEPLAFVPQSPNETTGEINTDSSLYTKFADVTKLTVGYSREFMRPQLGGEVALGASINMYRVTLSKSVLKLDGFEGEDFVDVVTEKYDQKQAASWGLGLDVGALWRFDDWQLGFVIENLNEPTFNYGSLVENCNLILDPRDRDNCFVANVSFNDRIALSEKARLSTQYRLEGSYLLFERQVELSSFLELAEAYDLLADKQQFFGLSASYKHPNTWYPSIRLGFLQNMTGTEMSMLAIGSTLFGCFNLDLTYGMDSTSVDGEQYPRVFSINLGFEQAL